MITLCGVLLFFLLPACRQKSVGVAHPVHDALVCVNEQNDAYELWAMQQEMALVDIPVPLYHHRIVLDANAQDSQNNVVLAYATALSYDELADFYAQEMERLGWSMLKKFITTENQMFIFCTPARLCLVMLQPLTTDGNQPLHKIVVCVGGISAYNQLWRTSLDEHAGYALVQDDLW